MKSGKFYGIGVGPGNYDLLTIRAVKVLSKVDVIVSPIASEGSISFAEEIIKEYKNPKAIIQQCLFPMGYGKIVEEAHRENFSIIKKILSEGKEVAFITLGHPLFFSTFLYIKKFLEEEKFFIEIVPGIFSFSEIAAKLNITLGIKQDKLAVISSFESAEEILNLIKIFDTIVFMKIVIYFEKLKKILLQENLISKCKMISNCGNKNEKIYSDISNINQDNIPYLTTMILRK